MTNIQTKIRKSDFYSLDTMDFLPSQDGCRLFHRDSFYCELGLSHLDSPGDAGCEVFHTVVYHCLPTISCWIHMLGISLPPLLRAVEYLVMDVWADLLRFGTLSQNPFENEGLD